MGEKGEPVLNTKDSFELEGRRRGAEVADVQCETEGEVVGEEGEEEVFAAFADLCFFFDTT